jgi:hypothetical protein
MSSLWSVGHAHRALGLRSLAPRLRRHRLLAFVRATARANLQVCLLSERGGASALPEDQATDRARLGEGSTLQEPVGWVTVLPRPALALPEDCSGYHVASPAHWSLGCPGAGTRARAAAKGVPCTLPSVLTLKGKFRCRNHCQRSQVWRALSSRPSWHPSASKGTRQRSSLAVLPGRNGAAVAHAAAGVGGHRAVL